jgi:hypothetical protein
MPVGVERTQVEPGAVVHVVERNLRVPALNGAQRTRGHADAKNPAGDLEQTRQHARQRKIRPELLLVEIVARPAQSLGPEGGFPRRQRCRGGVGLLRLERLEFTALAGESGLHPAVHILDEGQRRRATPRHAALQHEVRKVGLAEQHSLLLAQRENALDEIAIVLGALASDGRSGRPHLPAQVRILGVEHDRFQRRSVQGEPPDGGGLRPLPFLERALPGGLAGMRRQASQPGRVGDEQFPGVRRIKDILGVFLREQGEFALHGFEPRLLIGGQVGALLAEIRHGFIHEAPVLALQGRHRRQRGRSLEAQPDPDVQGDFGEKGRDLWQHGVVRVAQRRRIRHRGEVRDLGPGFVQQIGCLFQGEAGVLVIDRLHGQSGDAGQRGLGVGEGRFDCRAHALRGELRPGNLKGTVEKGIVHLARKNRAERRAVKRIGRAHHRYAAPKAICLPAAGTAGTS